MSQASSRTSNALNRLLDNLTETIIDNNILTPSFNTISSAATTALTAVSSSFRLSNIKNSFSLHQQMDLFSNSATSSHLNDSSLHFTASNVPIKVDKKLFERLNKLADKVHKYCQCERMRLVNSPPYIIDIIPDICQMLNIIQMTYENKMHVLNDIEYFNVFSRNLSDKLTRLVELFKQAGKRIYDETSDERTRLTKYTLILSHMLAEIKSMFPKDVYEGQSFRIAKQDAADFWRNSFKEKAVVGWEEFERKLNTVHKISNKMESVKLRRTIQLTESNYVSIFEFDIFTRLFQPWNNLLNNWKFLATEHPGYSAFSTYDEIHKRLQKFINKPGSYLYRLSCTKLGQWAIGYVTTDHKILQTIPQSLVQALIDGQKQNLYLYPNGCDATIDISTAIEVTSATRVQISKEQYDMYCDMGTSFQLCKICSENNKDRKLEPCGHMICSSCLESWQDHNNTTPSCPFCRCEIKTFEPIIISPFETNKSKVTNTRRSSSLDPSELLTNNFKNESIDNVMLNKFNSVDDIDEDDSDKNGQYLNPINKSPISSKNTSPDGVRSTNDPNEDNDTYLLPNILSNSKLPRITNENMVASIIKDNHILNKKSNEIINKNGTNENLISSISDLNLRDISNSTRITSTSTLSPPIFPPPLPPNPLNLTPPSIPPPVPPIPNIFLNSGKFKSIVTANDLTDKNVLQIRIENNVLLEELVNKFGYDKFKVACALIISNNDINLAYEILLKTPKN